MIKGNRSVAECLREVHASNPGKGAIRTTNQQRKQDRFRQKANSLMADSLRLYVGIKNKWVQERELADLTPARINVLNDLYFQEFCEPCPWFQDRLTINEAEQLGLHVCEEEVGVLDIEAAEFIPAEYTVVEDEQCESGYVTGTVTPVLHAVTEQLETLQLQRTLSTDTLTFGDFESCEVEAIVSGVEFAAVVPDSTIDFISDVVDHHSSERVVNVITPISPDASSGYYGDSTLAAILQVCECSLLVKSLMTKPKVRIAQAILKTYRPMAYTFIARASKLGLLEDRYLPRVVNSLCDDAYHRTGKKLLNPRTRFKLVGFLKYMNHEYKGNRLSRYLEPDLWPRHYEPRAPRTKRQQR